MYIYVQSRSRDGSLTEHAPSAITVLRGPPYLRTPITITPRLAYGSRLYRRASREPPGQRPELAQPRTNGAVFNLSGSTSGPGSLVSTPAGGTRPAAKSESDETVSFHIKSDKRVKKRATHASMDKFHLQNSKGEVEGDVPAPLDGTEPLTRPSNDGIGLIATN